MTSNVAQEENKAEPANESIAKGERLRETRESMGLSLDDVSRKLHMEKRFIVALECGDHSVFSGNVYVYGCMRAYAKLLKLPIDKFTADITEQKPVNLDELEPLIDTIQPEKSNPGWIFYSMLLVLIVSVIWFVSETDDDEKIEVVDIQSGSDAIVGTADRTPVGDAGSVNDEIKVVADDNMQPPVTDKLTVANTIKHLDNESELVLEYNEASWTDIKDASGKQLVYRIVEKGAVINLVAISPFKILLGYSAGVVVKHNSKVFDHSTYTHGNVAYFSVGEKLPGSRKIKPVKAVISAVPAIKEKQIITELPTAKEKTIVDALPGMNQNKTEEILPSNRAINTDEPVKEKEVMFDLFPD